MSVSNTKAASSQVLVDDMKRLGTTEIVPKSLRYTSAAPMMVVGASAGAMKRCAAIPVKAETNCL